MWLALSLTLPEVDDAEVGPAPPVPFAAPAPTSEFWVPLEPAIPMYPVVRRHAWWDEAVISLVFAAAGGAVVAASVNPENRARRIAYAPTCWGSMMPCR